MDFGSLMGMMGPPPPQMSRPAREEDEVSDIVSIDAGDPDTREVEVKKGKGKGKKKEVSL
jgi:hypothetical protein